MNISGKIVVCSRNRQEQHAECISENRPSLKAFDRAPCNALDNYEQEDDTKTVII